jgi:hypothetical protein
MTSSLLVAAAEAQPVRYGSPLSSHILALTASCVASGLALWREDGHHRGIRKTGRYLRKRWWVVSFGGLHTLIRTLPRLCSEEGE